MSCYNPMERALKSIGNVSPTLLSIKNSILLTEQSSVRSVDFLIPGKSCAELLGFYGEAMGVFKQQSETGRFRYWLTRCFASCMRKRPNKSILGQRNYYHYRKQICKVKYLDKS